ncbi:hypothetical protein D9V41_13400 [Aeromicrobium phragmitis]|uniref:Carbohydrate kinase PfkB domain-containing protein n=1 Tax=Aeromicrobium phragmitis TaxID=2478914 RepID=A0A3L8PJX3_9ACTN|nr:PfkB family carbohydrate kinase [Aeromicrobium phragmitis]RLV55079.1 hypothetical protein D9V41_13400 [Aeromicrobium phragmitis]
MKILGAGDNVVDRYRRLGLLFPGGNAVNVAVFASRLGARAAYMGVLGDDAAGRHVLAALRAEGVDTTWVTTAHGHNAYADVDIVGTDRVFLGSDRSVQPFDPTPAQLDAMAEFDAVHSGYAGSLWPYVAQMAGRTKVSFDFGSRFDVDAVLPDLQYLYLAAFSASHLSAEGAEALVARALDAGATYVVATRGGEGAYVGTPGGILFQDAEYVTVRDTLGAGDAFIASVLVGLLSNRDVRATCAAASAHAAQVCLEHGAFGHPLPHSPSDPASDSKVVSS